MNEEQAEAHKIERTNEENEAEKTFKDYVDELPVEPYQKTLIEAKHFSVVLAHEARLLATLLFEYTQKKSDDEDWLENFVNAYVKSGSTPLP